jgi:carboxylesterase type B
MIYSGPVTEQPHFPEYPPVLLAKAQYDHSVSLMTGHNSDEGSLFASPFIRDNSDYADFLQSLLPGIPRSALSTLTQELYPNDLSGQQGYVDQLGRVEMTIAEALIVCNAYSLDTAFESKNDSFAYEFTVPPGLHAEDLPYTFLDPDEPESGVNITLARLMQTYFTNFAVTGSPNSGILPVPSFPKISGLTVENFNITMFGPMRDNIPIDRCDWWQRGLFRPPK